MRDALQGGSLAEAGPGAGISDRAAGGRNVSGEASFIDVIATAKEALPQPSWERGFSGAIDLGIKELGLHLISTTPLLGDLGQTKSLKPTISSE